MAVSRDWDPGLRAPGLEARNSNGSGGEALANAQGGERESLLLKRIIPERHIHFRLFHTGKSDAYAAASALSQYGLTECQ